jgi:peptidoglycan/LPS O-acetylase OafA/YrhL
MLKAQSIDKNLSLFLDVARGVAAFLVMAGHLRSFFFSTYADLNPEYHNIINYFLFFITRIGHECVILFFVLSGYLVGGNLLKSILEEKLLWKKYFTDRLIRMYVVFLPALLLGFILDTIRCSSLGDCFQTTPFEIETVLGNIFFLHTIAVPIFTSNVALWSLANELWYYLLFPLLLLPLIFKIHNIIRIISVVLILMISYTFMPQIIQLFPLWILGAVIRLVPPPIFLKKKIFLGLFYIFFFLSIGYSNIYHTLLGNYLVGIAFSLLILFHSVSTVINFRSIKRPATFLANISFSLYAIHLPIMFLLLALFQHITPFNERLINAGFTEWGFYLGLLLIIMILSFVFYQITEKHTYFIRKRAYLRLKI